MLIASETLADFVAENRRSQYPTRKRWGKYEQHCVGDR
jgi:hypothetical protein